MNNEAYSLAWLPFLPLLPDDAALSPAQMAAAEWRAGTEALEQRPALTLVPEEALGEGWTLAQTGETMTLRGGGSGLLYGVYAILMALASGETLPVGSHKPFYPLRMINCWDNAEGTVERGYAGRSLFFEGGRLSYDPARMAQLGRMLASVGLNVLCINNVNVHDPAHLLIEDWLPETAALAAILRPFGVKLMLSVDFAQPMRHGVPTADPLDARVQEWWNAQAAKVYAAIPDLAGFLVKADSEHRPGPFTYGRDHADGANMLARAIAPFGGTLVWRCFVYNCQQDWRDAATDRPKAAYDHYAYLDGRFDDNVILQIKHGPFDFQVREPLSPLLFAMPQTVKAMELQLAQEYTGHQLDLYYMAPMWKELYELLPPENVRAIAAVSNLGRDANWTGHPLAQANLFAYGRLAWDPRMDGAAALRCYCRLVLRLPPAQEEKLCAVLQGSRAAYEKYTANLGMCWMITPHDHYGPSPEGYEFSPWGTYHKADRNAIGIDRTAAGTGYTLQYPPEIRALYEDRAACPDELLLFFHRVPYDFVMRDGRTLIQRLYDDHFAGLREVEEMAETLAELELPEPERTCCLERMAQQLRNAREWCDILNTFFHRFSGVPDAQGRKLWP